MRTTAAAAPVVVVAVVAVDRWVVMRVSDTEIGRTASAQRLSHPAIAVCCHLWAFVVVVAAVGGGGGLLLPWVIDDCCFGLGLGFGLGFGLGLGLGFGYYQCRHLTETVHHPHHLHHHHSHHHLHHYYHYCHPRLDVDDVVALWSHPDSWYYSRCGCGCWQRPMGLG